MGDRQFRILILADYGRKRLREDYKRHYRASKRKYGDDVVWAGYEDVYDPDGRIKADFGYDGRSVIFNQLKFDEIFGQIKPKKLIKWDIYVIAAFNDGHCDVYGETFNRTFSDVTGDFTDHLDSLVEQLRGGREISYVETVEFDMIDYWIYLPPSIAEFILFGF